MEFVLSLCVLSILQEALQQMVSEKETGKVLTLALHVVRLSVITCAVAQWIGALEVFLTEVFA